MRGIAGFVIGLVLAYGLASMAWSLRLRRIGPRLIVAIALVPALALWLNLVPGGDGFGLR